MRVSRLLHPRAVSNNRAEQGGFSSVYALYAAGQVSRKNSPPRRKGAKIARLSARSRSDVAGIVLRATRKQIRNASRAPFETHSRSLRLCVLAVNLTKATCARCRRVPSRSSQCQRARAMSGHRDRSKSARGPVICEGRYLGDVCCRNRRRRSPECPYFCAFRVRAIGRSTNAAETQNLRHESSGSSSSPWPHLR